jgi:hypothetical protein
MERRAFLTGLFGVAGAVALARLAPGTAQAAPIARMLSGAVPQPELPRGEAGRTPDGTPVEQAQVYRRRRRPGPRRRLRRRRRSRLVCRTYRVRGRRVRRCRRVFWR